MKLGLVLALSAICVIGIHSSCLPLHDGNAKIWNGLLGNFIKDKDATLAKIKAMNLPPASSKCAGSLDIDLGTALGLLGHPSCKRAMKEVFPNFSPPFNNDMTMKPKYAKVKKDLTTIYEKHSKNHYALALALRDYTFSVPKSLHNDIGKLVHKDLADCVKAQVIPALFSRAIDGSCCDDMRAKFNEFTNKDLTRKYLTEVLFKILDVPLSMMRESTCSFAMIQSVLKGEITDHTKAFVSTPNDQACQASNGQEFVTTKRMNHKYDDAIGCCAKSFDQLLLGAMEYPIVKKYVDVNIFASGKCWSPSQAQIDKALSYITDPKLKELAKNFLKDSCFHLANNFSAGCTFKPAKCEYVSSQL